MDEDAVVPFLEELPEALEKGVPVILPGAITRGFIWPQLKFAVVSEGDLFRRGQAEDARHCPHGQ